MDILKIYHDLAPCQTGPQRKSAAGAEFNAVLEKKMNVGGAQPTGSLDSSQQKVIEKGERLLALLDDYAAQLKDPGASLKDIGGLVETIKNETRHVREDQAALNKTDPALDDIVDALTLTATVAAYKFDRGDYV